MVSLKEQLIKILIEDKLLTPQQLESALKVQKEKGGRLSDIIVEMNFIKRSDLAMALSQGLNLPLIDLKRCKIDPEVASIVPENIIRHYQIIPISKMGDTLTVAMVDPLNVFAIDHIQALTGYKINPIIISEEKDLQEVIREVYPDTTMGFVDEILKEISDTTFEFIKEERESLPSLEELTRSVEEAPIIRLTNSILEEAVEKRASDILIEPQKDTLRIRFRIDGILQEVKSPPKSMYPLIVSRIKVISDLDIAEHRLPQEGRFKAKIKAKEIDFRVSILPSIWGEKVALRILDRSQAMLDIEKLGFDNYALNILKKMALLPHGMIMVCGPTGSGKTTTLYSILKYIDSPEKNIITVEDPVEYQIEGINQVSVNPQIGLTFASALRSILRQDPDIIMIGEIRDLETTDIAIKSALTGHLVLSTLHTTTAAGAVARLLNMGTEPYLICASLLCVLAQRLLRKLCPHCKEKYTLKPDLIRELKITQESKEVSFYRAKGCKACFNTGYIGRIAIAEILTLTAGIKELILTRAQEHIIKQKARQEGMITLRENALALAKAGITSLEEVLRTTSSDD
ncbi:MAG: Flp pilus assembly complex ATPase component TadA [Candidatus Omnitrophica bacterium]|nr:Flp pilus assembly complex ATPase component TadA [Candidatus Omnitrophota bacterium]